MSDEKTTECIVCGAIENLTQFRKGIFLCSDRRKHTLEELRKATSIQEFNNWYEKIMLRQKITECFFEDIQCLWQGNPNCKACARGRNYLYPQRNITPWLMIMILGLALLFVLALS